jgi:signal transduction histidine kinase
MALLLGFGVTFGLWLFVGIHFAQRIAEAGRKSEDLNARYTQSQELLSNLRAQVLLGSIYLRDALLDPASGDATEYRRQIADADRQADLALQQYQPVAETPVALARMLELRRELDEFHATLTDILGTDSTRWVQNARVLLRDRIVPKRQLVIRMSEDIQALNRNAFVQQQSDIAAFYADAERQIWESLGIALFISLGIGVTATLYAGRLEGRLNRQRADLQRLSAKIVSAQEDERRAIARELHDEVGQLLTAVKVELALAHRHVEAAKGPTEALHSVRDIADRALHTVRNMSHLLHPSLLDDLGLPAAIDSYLQEFGKRHGIRVELLQAGMQERLAPATEAAAYRIVQEALTNVANHARAAECRVQLQRLPSTVLVIVDDNGLGFDPTAADSVRSGLGLIGIRERVAQLMGTLRLESAPGKGTRLTVVLPVAPQAEQL